MRVIKNELSGSGLKVILSIVGISFIFIILTCFDVFGFNQVKQMINDISLSESNYSIEVVYYIFLSIFLLFAIGCPIYLYIIAGEIKGISIRLKANQSSILNPENVFQNKKSYASIFKPYSRTFINNAKEENYKQYNNKTRVNAAQYFNAEEIVCHHFPKLPLISFLKLISGSFLGLGILGSFVSLSQVLDIGINIQNQGQLNIIVEGVKVAFNISIFGIFSSIIYNFFIVHPVIQLLNDRSRFLCDLLDSIYYVSDEECLRKLGTIVCETADKISTNSNEVLNKLADIILEGREGFIEELDKTANTLRNVTYEFEKTPNAIKVMNEELRDSINVIKENHENMFNNSIKIIEDNVSSLFNNFASRFDESSKNIRDSIASLHTLPNELNRVIEQTNSIYHESVVSLMKETKDKLSNLIKEATSVSKVELNSLKEQLNETYCSYKDIVSELIGRIEETSQKIVGIRDDYGNIGESFNEIARNVEKVELKLNDTFARVPKEIDNAVARFVDTAIITSQTTEKLSELKQIPDVVTDIFNQFSATTKMLETTYEGVLKKIELLYDVCNNKEKNTSDALKKYIETIDIASMTSLKSEQALKEVKDSVEKSHSLLHKILDFLDAGKKIKFLKK